MDITSLTLFGRARAGVLAVLADAAGKGNAVDRALGLREIARRSAISPTAAQYELRQLLLAGLIGTVAGGRGPRYFLNPRHALYRELRALLRKAAALEQEALITDDAYWKAKRSQQQKDYAAASPEQKSPFFADSAAVRSGHIKLSDDTDYDYG